MHLGKTPHNKRGLNAKALSFHLRSSRNSNKIWFQMINQTESKATKTIDLWKTNMSARSGLENIQLAAAPTLCHDFCLWGWISSQFPCAVLLPAISPCWTPCRYSLWSQCKTAIYSRTLTSRAFSNTSNRCGVSLALEDDHSRSSKWWCPVSPGLTSKCFE